MNGDTLSYLCCPRMKTPLRQELNKLQTAEGASYDIQQGIPLLIDLDHLNKDLQQQVEYFEKERTNRDAVYRLDPWQKRYADRFLNNFGDFANKVIIDCGAGSGYMTVELARRGAQVIACDLTLKSLIRLKNIVQQHGLQNQVSLVCCSAEELPFQTGIADYFISNAVLEHLPREKEAISEISRVCKPNAGLLIAVPVNFRYVNPLLLAVNYIHDKRIGHLRRYNQENLVNKFPRWRLCNAYYSGHSMKVLKVIANRIVHAFDDEAIEAEDEKKQDQKWWSSNIICTFSKNG